MARHKLSQFCKAVPVALLCLLASALVMVVALSAPVLAQVPPSPPDSLLQQLQGQAKEAEARAAAAERREREAEIQRLTEQAR